MADLTLADGTLSTSDDASCSDIVPQSGGADICVVHAASITLGAGDTLRVTGSRVLALVADGSLTLDGTIDGSGDGAGNGPGGGTASSGGPADINTGGGGAGFHTSGGDGATNVDGGAMNGGAAHALPAALQGGDSATDLTAGLNRRGGGGGGMTLISCHDVVSIGGLIDVGGGGGRGGKIVDVNTALGGSGGGSGGVVVVQGLAVRITGEMYANGGAGGGTDGNGEDGTRSMIGAAGGGTVGVGGVGGANSTTPGSGHGASRGGGGGGGSVGFLKTCTPSGRLPEIDATTSPPLEPNAEIEVR